MAGTKGPKVPRDFKRADGSIITLKVPAAPGSPILPRDPTGAACLEANAGKEVLVHFDRHANKRTFVVRDAAGPGEGSKKPLLCEAGSVHLKDVKFEVDEKKWRKDVQDGSRTVHAWARGTLVGAKEKTTLPSISYNPFSGPYWFRRSDGSPIANAREAVLVSDPKDNTSVLEGLGDFLQERGPCLVKAAAGMTGLALLARWWLRRNAQ